MVKKYNIDEDNKNIFNTEGVSDKDILNSQQISRRENIRRTYVEERKMPDTITTRA